jgi:hypothetical protein
MELFREHDVVRVDSLKSARPDLSLSARLPVVGDMGTIVNVLAPDEFIVEAVGTEGSTEWLCDFNGSDLALVTRHD